MSILQLPPAASAPPAPDSPPGGGSGGPPGPPFASVLEHHQARTATAEGLAKKDQNQQPAKQPSGNDSAPVEGSTVDPVTPGAKDEPVTVADASTLAAMLGGVPAKPAVTTAAAAVPTAGDATAAGTGTTSPAAGSPAGAVVDAANVAPTTAPTTAPAPAAPGTAQDSPVSAVAQPTVGRDATPQFAAPHPSASGTPVPGSTPETSLPTSPQNDAATSAVTGDKPVTAAPAPAGPIATTAPVAAPQVTAAPSAPPAAAVAQPAGVALEHAIETVRLALRAAADRGVSHARIELHPRELGGVEIHLRQTADGLVARVVAEHATAAQLLQHAGGELRRSLETQGLTLLRLDIGASGEQSGRAPGEQRGFGDPAGEAGNGGADDATSGDDLAITPTETTLTLANGALVDVLA